jgi:threonine dehydrogenase-like Zn-dependent dehydrogenase
MTTMAPQLLERESKSTATMRALVFHSPNQIAIENVPVPKAGAGEAVIRVTLTTICGTDIHM